MRKKPEDKKATGKYASMYMSIGMCIGIGIGMCLGNAIFDNLAMVLAWDFHSAALTVHHLTKRH